MNTLQEFLSAQASQRTARVAELESALDAGQHIMQDGQLWPECSPFVPVSNRYLAEHIERRERGFGMRTVVLNDFKLSVLGYACGSDGRWFKVARQEAEVERNVDPAPFYGMRGDA